MHDNRQPPRGLEYKSAPALAPATPAPAARRHATRITAALGPTGVPYQGDIVERGALGRAIKARLPRVAVGHSWARPAGIVLGGVEVGPGDPRLPATTSDGQPWPRDGGGLILTVDVGPSTTRDGALATKAAQAAGHGAAWTFGYKVTAGRTAGGIRRVTALDIYSVAPPTISSAETKSAVVVEGLEIKGAGGMPVSVQLPTDGRWSYRCSLCGLPSGLADVALPDTARYVCRSCVESIGALVDPLPPLSTDGDEPLDGPHPHRVGAESAYRQALDAEQEWSADPVGELLRRDDDQRWRP